MRASERGRRGRSRATLRTTKRLTSNSLPFPLANRNETQGANEADGVGPTSMDEEETGPASQDEEETGPTTPNPFSDSTGAF